ncbi:MAG: hypothetical protein K2G13_07925, partial [Muribaculaceae bacterium]|nr:hypothetical protein [Muribaculaceae bacterium]
YQADARRDEQLRLALDERTVDAVNTGEQQPEADHQMKLERSSSGNFNGEPWRDASNGGFFSYIMNTGDRDDLTLRVRYWGNENGIGTMSILVDETPLAKVNNISKWNKNGFVDEEYSIPAELIKGKKTVNVKFQTDKNEATGGIYHVRLLHP